MSTSIYVGGLYTKDPNNRRVLTVNWDISHLPAGVSIADSTWFVTGPDTALTLDQESIVISNRKTKVRLNGGTRGLRYKVINRIVTDENPEQDADAMFFVLIQD